MGLSNIRSTRRALLLAATTPWLAARAATGVRIGQVLPLTGPLGAVVQPIAEGQKALLAGVNARGGVHGAPIELVTLDDGAQPAKTVEHTRTLLDDPSLSALFGYAFVPGLAQALPLADARRVPLIGVYNGADNLRGQPGLYTTTASLRDEVTAMVQNLATINTRHLAVAYQDNELGRYMLPQVQAVADQAKVTIAAAVALKPDGSNADAAWMQVAKAQPQAILLLAAGAAVLGFMKTRSSAARVPVYALSLAGTTALVESLGPAARGMAFTQVVPYPMRQTTPLTRNFAAAMAAARLEPTYDRMWGYLNASILVEVLRRSGPKPTPAAVTAALDRMNDVDIGGYRLAYGAQQRHGSSFVEITMVDGNGKYLR
ncbi:ABC transporter substrate-binding protein [Ramlibacter sp. XY19]|uniref:ABC transporter substrate-binding protein n=1 Tax=Ramlibacter paludis TaxID=2908000 RepID=UPI0023D9B9B3|nr:ABC transporter substrate-binding protein [Ramlibacter paludis]MCG2594314.1 ABC transporter substrate-binding protein [Ramlibacter paludis]